MKTANQLNTRKLVLLGLLTAIVVVLQALATALPIYPFTLTLTLVPMVIGAALISPLAGGWLGLVFGLVVLISGNANLFLAVSPLATIVIVLVKGAGAGLASGYVYRLFAKKNRTVATIASAVVCPIVNTGIFTLGCYALLMPTLTEWTTNTNPDVGWALDAGFSNVTTLIFIGFIGINFFIELAINIVLSPTIVRLVQYGQDKKATQQ
ncbi:MAG: ECF transporter S component [Oscillospiraceae bacterium]|nr:ECF transporter S component [Oscillospiraceae bacterium]